MAPPGVLAPRSLPSWAWSGRAGPASPRNIPQGSRVTDSSVWLTPGSSPTATASDNSGFRKSPISGLHDQQESDIVHFLGERIPAFMRLFTLWAVATGLITGVNLKAGATASLGHWKSGQSISITISACRSMLYHHVLLAKLLQPRGLLVLGAPESQQLYQTMVVRTHNELPTQQVVPVHACKTHHGQQLLPGCAIPPLLPG